MYQRRLILMIASMIAIATAAYMLGAARNVDRFEAPALRTYTVPNDRAHEVKDALNSLLKIAGAPDGSSAQDFGANLLAVKAPTAIQESVETLIKKMAENNKPRKSLKIEYWLVIGEAAVKSGPRGFDENLLKLALDAIESTQGPHRFRVADHIAFNSVEGQGSELKSRMHLEVQNVASLIDGRVYLKSEIKSHAGQLKAEVDLAPNEFVVLGQNAVPVKEQPGQSGDLMSPTVHVDAYYVVRAEPSK